MNDACIIVQTDENGHLVLLVFGVLYCYRHPFESKVDDLIDLFHTQTASDDLLLVRREHVGIVNVIEHHIDIDKALCVCQNLADSLSNMAQLFVVLGIDLYNDGRQCRRP